MMLLLFDVKFMMNMW